MDRIRGHHFNLGLSQFRKSAAEAGGKANRVAEEMQVFPLLGHEY
jgi:hypothetical protein